MESPEERDQGQDAPEGSDQAENDPRGEGIEGGSSSTGQQPDKISGEDTPEGLSGTEGEEK